MEGNYFDIEDKKENPYDKTIKIKLFHKNKKSLVHNPFEKGFEQNLNSICSNETNERTILRAGEVDTNTSLKNGKEDKISTIKIIPSLSITNLSNNIQPIIIPSSCLNTISNIGDIYMKENCSYTNNSNTTFRLLINLIPEVKYNPMPEREYFDDILSELLIEEENNSHYKSCIYIEYQKDLDNQKRAELISFIYYMSKIYNFKNKTIFLTVQTMDRFLCKEKIDPEYYDLLCICSLVISSKFNEIYFPAYKDIIPYFANDKGYTPKQALTMEILILKTINYDLLPIFPMNFFDIIAQKCEFNDIEYYLGCLMIELIQFDFCLYPFKNSILSQIIFCKVVSLTRDKKYKPLEVLKEIFPKNNLQFDNENSEYFLKASNCIDELLHNLTSDYFKEIYQKYSQPNILGNSINYFLNL